MDSLLATYVSSDEDSDDSQPTTTATTTTTTTCLFSSLPKPQSTSSPFSSLPIPKSNESLISPSIPKKIVQFQPPLPPNPPDFDDDDDDDDDVERDRNENKKVGIVSSSVKSFLSSMPTPKSSLGSALGFGAVGSNCRAVLDADGPSPSVSSSIDVKTDVGFVSSVSNSGDSEVECQGNGVSGPGSESYEVGGLGNWVSGSNSGSYEAGFECIGGNGQGNWVDGSNSGNYEAGVGGYEGYGGVYESSSGYDSHGSYGQYDANSGGYDGLSNSVPVESYVNKGGKRRRDQVPVEIVEVKQDELMKNRPREDKSKLTGIAFGPSYQPAATKGKPSKLHKRKHQIGSLYYDLKSKEMELAERRSKGLLTKAETQAKYGW